MGDRQVLIQRVTYGSATIVTLIGLFVVDVAVSHWATRLDGCVGDLLSRGSVIPLLTLGLFLRSAVEVARMLRLTGSQPAAWLSHSGTTALVLCPWFSAAGWLGRDAARVEGFWCVIVVLMVTLLVGGADLVRRRMTDRSLRDLGATWLIVAYVGLLGSFTLQIHCGRDFPDGVGPWMLLLVVLTTKAGDIGAYFVGSTLGRHKLVPSISPAKSIEGAVGALSASALFAAVVGMFAAVRPSRTSNVILEGIVGLVSNPTMRLLGDRLGDWAFIKAGLFGLLISVVGQIGDLLESCFKRDAVVKDSSSVIPRFGGILDLVDSLLFAIPVAWLVFSMVF